jgi:hypothetical protein
MPLIPGFARRGRREPLAETFAALSGRSDTLDTMRHSGVSRSTVSQSVKSVMAAPAVSEPAVPAAADRPLAVWDETEAESAAIVVEHDGNIPREWAESFAHLNRDHPPGDVPPARWQRFIDDMGLLLDSPFCAIAAALGWQALDLFGCDHDRPFARIDKAGLLWLLNGDRLIALSENTATIETRSGARQTWRRKPHEPGRVLAWELIRLVAVGAAGISRHDRMRRAPDRAVHVGDGLLRPAILREGVAERLNGRLPSGQLRLMRLL